MYFCLQLYPLILDVFLLTSLKIFFHYKENDVSQHKICLEIKIGLLITEIILLKMLLDLTALRLHSL